MDDIPVPIPAGSTRLMDQLRADMRARGYAFSTERTYLHWIKRYILYNQRRHPADMGKAEIEAFLNHLAVHVTVSPSTQRTALNALMYLYTKYYGREPESLSFNYAKPTRRLPTVLSHEEAKAILCHMSGTPRLMVELLYGCLLPLRKDFAPRFRKCWPFIGRISPMATLFDSSPILYKYTVYVNLRRTPLPELLQLPAQRLPSP